MLTAAVDNSFAAAKTIFKVTLNSDDPPKESEESVYWPHYDKDPPTLKIDSISITGIVSIKFNTTMATENALNEEELSLIESKRKLNSKTKTSENFIYGTREE